MEHKWWPGLNPLALLWVAALWSTTQPLERELAARAGQALEGMCSTSAARGVRPRPDLRGGGVLARGPAKRGRRHRGGAGHPAGGRRKRLVPEARPFVWTIERDVVRVTLGAARPLPAIRAALRSRRVRRSARLRLSTTRLARGAPPRFDAAATLLIEQVAKLKERASRCPIRP